MCLTNGTLFNLSSLPGRLSRIIDCASSKACSSELNSRHGAVLAKGNRIVACATNESRSKWGSYCNCCMHAEVNVIRHYCSSLLKQGYNEQWVLPRFKVKKET